MMPPRWTTLLAAAALIVLPGCGDGSTASAGQSERPDIVTAFYPLQFVASRVGGDRVAVGNLTEPGAEPHDLELTPKQVGELGEADLVVYIEGFQPAVDEGVEQNAADGKALEVSSVVPKQGEDPHIWLDPTKLATVATAVGDRLARIDPGDADTYRADAERLAAELAALDGEYRSGLANCRYQTFVTSHEAFGYLARRYGLEQVPIAGLSPEAEPSPQQVAAVQKLVRAEGITTAFFETLVSPKLAETIARDTGADTAVLDPIEGIENGSSADYFSVMRANLEALRKALSCT